MCLNDSSDGKRVGWMKGREAGCPFETACGPSATPRTVGSWALGLLGGRAMHAAEGARVPGRELGEVG